MSYKNPISREDPNAIEKLYEKLAECERLQDTMKEVNSYYRKEGKVIGCPCLTEKQADALDESMRRRYPMHTQPYPPYALTNNSAEIRRLKKRIEELSVAKETEYVGWEFEGGEVVPNKENCRLQIFFDEKPDEEKRSALKMRGFHWSPTEGAWQRQLNSNATRQETDANGNVVEVTEEINTVYVTVITTPKSAAQIADEYGFTAQQKEMLSELLSSENAELWAGLLGK